MQQRQQGQWRAGQLDLVALESNLFSLVKSYALSLLPPSELFTKGSMKENHA